MEATHCLPRELIEDIGEQTPRNFMLVDKGFYRNAHRMLWNFTLFIKRLLHGCKVYCVRMRLGRENPVDWMSMYFGEHSYSPRLLLPPSSCAVPYKFHPFVIGGDTSNYCIYDYQKNTFVTIPRIPIMYWAPHQDDPRPEHRILTCSSIRDNGAIIKLKEQYAHYWMTIGDTNASYLLTVPDWDDSKYGDLFVGCSKQTAIDSGLAYIVRHPGEAWYEFLQQTPRCQSQRIRFSHNMPSSPDTSVLSHPTCTSLSWDEVNCVFDGLLKLDDANIENIGDQHIEDGNIEPDGITHDLVIFAEVTNVATGASAHIYTLYRY